MDVPPQAEPQAPIDPAGSATPESNEDVEVAAVAAEAAEAEVETDGGGGRDCVASLHYGDSACTEDLIDSLRILTPSRTAPHLII